MNGGVSLLERKLRAQAQRDEAEKQATNHRAINQLIIHYLQTNNLLNSSATLLKELQTVNQSVNQSTSQYTLCDNIDIQSILTEWIESYEKKFGRPPKLIKRNETNQSTNQSVNQSNKQSANQSSKKSLSSLPSIYAQDSMTPSALPAHMRSAYHSTDSQSINQSTSQSYSDRPSLREEKSQIATDDQSIKSTKLKRPKSDKQSSQSTSQSVNQSTNQSINQSEDLSLSVSGTKAGAKTEIIAPEPVNQSINQSVNQSINHLSFSPQYAEFAAIIERDILTTNPDVHWADIVELKSAKQLLQEAIVMPLRFPRFFTGLLSPWKGVLLYGPPGTGKTLLAKAVATECGTTFFNISSSSITSKYRGDSEKLIKTLFELAQHYAPSTIFIDEIDSLMSHRSGSDDSGNEASRRLKSELLIQFDGLAKCEKQVFILCASNLPWDLDAALLRRLEKRILVPLPNQSARQQLIQLHLTDQDRAIHLDYEKLARLTENYSGSDIVSLCKESAMRPVRRLMTSLMSTNENLAESDIDPLIELDRVSMRDVEAALMCTKPSAAVKDLNKYEEWHKQYGATIEQEEMSGTG